MAENEEIRKQIRNMAQWLREAFPRGYHVATCNMTLDTRPAKDPQEFMVVLNDDQHKLLYPIPVSMMKDILGHISILEQKGVKEFEAIEPLMSMSRETETESVVKVRGFGIIEDRAVGKWRTLWYKFLAFLRRGQREYCIQCLPSTSYYAYWLINTRRARIKPVSECKHGGKQH